MSRAVINETKLPEVMVPLTMSQLPSATARPRPMEMTKCMKGDSHAVRRVMATVSSNTDSSKSKNFRFWYSSRL